MSFSFTPDPNNVQTGEFEPVPKGEYEVYLSDIEKVQFNSGNEGLKLTYTIRDDISGQKYGRRKIFENLVALDSVKWKWNALAVAIGAPQTELTMEGFAKFAQGKPLIIGIDHRKYTDREGNERTQEVVRTYKPSQHAAGFSAPATNTAQPADPFAGGTPLNISEDDLPF